MGFPMGTPSPWRSKVQNSSAVLSCAVPAPSPSWGRPKAASIALLHWWNHPFSLENRKRGVLGRGLGTGWDQVSWQFAGGMFSPWAQIPTNRGDSSLEPLQVLGWHRTAPAEPSTQQQSRAGRSCCLLKWSFDLCLGFYSLFFYILSITVTDRQELFFLQ